MRQPRFALPIQLLIGGAIVTMMLLMAGVLLWYSWYQSERALGEAMQESSEQLSATVEARSRALVSPARVVAEMLASADVVEAPTFEERLASLPILAAALNAHELIDAVYIGYPSGDFLMLRSVARMPPALRPKLEHIAAGEYLVMSVQQRLGATPVSRWSLYDADLALLERQALDHYYFDPRTRPWFSRALRQAGNTLTAPYAFFNTGELGVTLARRARDGQAVVGLDVASGDLGAQVATLYPAQGARIAIVALNGQVLAHAGGAGAEPGATRLATLAELDEPALARLARIGSPETPVHFDEQGVAWWGLTLPFATLGDDQARMLVAVPEASLMADMRAMLWQRSLVAGGLVVALLVLGVWLGRRLGRTLYALSEQVQALARFDFAACRGVPSRIKEVRRLSIAIRRLASGIDDFRRITRVLGSEPHLDRMLARILGDLLHGSDSRHGAIYLVDEQDPQVFLRSTEAGRAGADSPVAERLTLAEGEGLEALIAAFGERGYLLQPLCNRDGGRLGLLAIAFRRLGGDEEAWRDFIAEISTAAAVAIDLRRLLKDEERLLQAIVQLVARATDAKSPHTGSHCSRVPELAEMILEGVGRTRHGAYADVDIDGQRRQAFHLAAWLHDCGKLATPDEIMEKATKLETRYNRIHEIRTRFEVLWRDADVRYWQGRAHGGDSVVLERHRRARQQELSAAFDCVAEANRGGESMSDALVERLESIAEWRWKRHFDDRLGLSRAELDRVAREPQQTLPAEERLLADLPRHEIDWYRPCPAVGHSDPANQWGFDMSPPELAGHQGELFNLRIARGTLNDVERFRIQEHVIQTIIMLESLPWPAHLKRVPSIAGNHHERVDGKGYPRGLMLGEASVEEKIMAMADVFEALTAVDRPYKAAMTLSRALAVLADMVNEGHLDAELYRLLLEEDIWRDYAERFLAPHQIDDVDVAALLKRANLVPMAGDNDGKSHYPPCTAGPSGS